MTLASELTDEAVARVDNHADEVWKETAWRALSWLAETRDEITTDDLWIALETYYPDVYTHDKRALGPLMRRVVKEGLFERSGTFTVSVRPEAHQAIVFHYRSLVKSS